ncbi:IS5/IS1182 family transposase [Amycolatopsis sp. WAC 01375]|uniref:transposase family protein n=1 Tax=Amycolatopsis sp. WAC 01375 TaxID=2203194 RepID=UPI000F7944DE|nr:transposase family protein [Amycolatopsis sp. WAC 01375]RSM82881.1 IS5/IS1182 family transposase [Amycolatopsis sp. WAC 01375]RSN19740.1 IS5/IS1182 family transposase [Amycolatopsis sp. WAC 01416]
MLSYPSVIEVSITTLRYVVKVIRDHLKRIGSPWRRLSPVQQAVLVLAHLRNGDTYARLAAGYGVGIATVFRYIRETTRLLAERAPTLTGALWQLAWSHNNYGILDGTVIRTDRIAANRPFYSGKHRYHGINLQGLTDPYGRLLWISDGQPGAVNDTAAARHHQIPGLAEQAGILLLADTGYHQIAPGVITPYKNTRNKHQTPRPLAPAYKAANTAHAATRGRGERGFATLKNWRILTRARCSTHHVTTHAKAILTLEHQG